MVPSAVQFKKLLREIFQAIPDTDPTKREKQIVFSAVISAAESVERMEKVLKEVITPALAALLKAGEPAPATDVSAPAAAEEELPPIQATTTASAPAEQPTGTVSTSPTTMPVNGQAGQPGGVSVSAPQPIVKPATA